MSGEYERPAPATATAVTEQTTRLGQMLARLESAATERRWADVAGVSREMLSAVSKILQRAQIIAELQADGTLER